MEALPKEILLGQKISASVQTAGGKMQTNNTLSFDWQHVFHLPGSWTPPSLTPRSTSFASAFSSLVPNSVLDGHHQAGLKEMQTVSQLLPSFDSTTLVRGNSCVKCPVQTLDPWLEHQFSKFHSSAPMSLLPVYKVFQSLQCGKFRLDYATGKFTTLVYLENR